MTVADHGPVSADVMWPRDSSGDEGIRPPRLPDVLVARPQLVARLDEATSKKLVVVAAPPGYGKTVLLTSWADSTCGRAVAWVTMSPTDDAQTVAAHLCASLTQVDGLSRDQIVDRVHPSGRRMGDGFVAAFLENAEALPPTTLVLDDFHALASGPVTGELASLIELAPPQLHFVVAARLDPPLSWHRLRLIDQVAELRADDLRFDAPDTTDLVGKLTGLELTATQVTALMTRTEGWVTGLQLASLSLRSSDDVEVFIDAFTGDDRHVAEYLTEHVLGRLEPGFRDFLLQTSVLDRLSGSLCDAVTRRNDGEAMLEQLSGESLFLSPIDRQRVWFRYHQLFRDLLRSHLRAAEPTRERVLLGRAAEWHLERDDIEVAGGYIAATGDPTRILNAVHDHGRNLHRRGHISTVIRWLDALPPATARQPDVALLEAGCRMLAGATGAATAILDVLDTADGLGAGEHLLIDLITTWSVHEAGDTERVLAASERALEELRALPERELPELSWLVRPGVIEKSCLINRATAEVFVGAHDLARVDLRAAARLPHANMSLALDETALVALIDAWDGSLRSAEQHARRAMGIADHAGFLAHPGAAMSLLVLARVARQQGRTHDARAWLDAAEVALQRMRTGLLQAVFTAESALVDLADDDPQHGLTIITEHRHRRVAPSPSWVAEQIDLAEVRLLVAVGDLDGARHLVDSLTGTGSEALDVKVLVAAEGDDLDRARRLLAEWPDDTGPRSRLQLMRWRCILVDGDSGKDAVGDRRLDRLLSLAGDEDRVQLLLDGGRLARRRFRSRCNAAPTPFLRRLVDRPPPRARGSIARRPQLIQQLTDRELAVLRYLPTRLENAEIAAELGITINTLKTHLKHIFLKFDVQGRRAAVDTAERFGLL